MREVRDEKIFGDTRVQLPYYTANRALGNTRDPYPLDQILKTVFSEKYEQAIQKYMEEMPEGVFRAIGEKESKDYQLITLGHPRYQSSWMQDYCHTAVDIEIPVTIEASVPIETRRQTSGLYIVTTTRKRYIVPFRMRYHLDLVHKKCSAPTVAPSKLFPRDEITEHPNTNEYLLPVIHQKDYPLIAGKMLEQYYPEALTNPTAVHGFELAKRMKAKVQIVRFDEKSDIQGQVFFEGAWTHFDRGIGSIGYYWVPRRTILINANLCKTPEVINSTIIHECCHLFLDMPFFLLQIMAGKPFQTHTSRRRSRGRREYRANTPVEWMELQAEKLPAFVLMEEENTRKEIERLLGLYGGQKTPSNIQWIIRSLAKTFQVSISMAKYRMIELGYPEAEGIFTFLDGERIPDHGCTGAWEPGIKYTISRLEAARMMIEDRAFAQAIQRGLYTYAEGHFCLDAEEYVHRDRNGKAILSAYARWHIDECCLSFYVAGRSTKVIYQNGQAAKHTPVTNALQTRHGLDAEPESRERIAQNLRYGRDAKLWAEVARARHEDIREAIFFVMKKKGLSQEEVGMRLGVTRTAFAGWFKRKMSLRHIVAICIAMDVRVDVSLEFIRLSGNHFIHNDEDELMMSFLFETSDLTVARANEIMRDHRMKPLTEGKSEELAAVM